MKKYRPVITEDEILYLSSLLDSVSDKDTREYISLAKKIELLVIKINAGLARPAYKTAPPKESTLESLGGIVSFRESSYRKKIAGEQLSDSEYQAYLDYVVAENIATNEEVKEWTNQ